ncbi:MAG: S-adenosyl-L-methionine-dependent methyltransferase [Piptocephalis tieghemiana]|nr:MAG: S-adenosyl-L-methionine-dependent methyltransferase [Piptocephalis tieghemiana]
MSPTSVSSAVTDDANRHHGEMNEDAGIIQRLSSKPREVHTQGIEQYRAYWKSKEEEASPEEKARRLAEYTSLTNTYYNLATDFYEYGWGRSFHFSRLHPGETFAASVARHEHYMAMRLGLREGMRVLDVGCGVGGPQREIAHFTRAHITGLNNNAYQLTRAEAYATKEGISELCSYHKGDFMQMTGIPDGAYDAVYAFEATVHAPQLSGVYGEIFRVLKPGGRFGNYEWVMTDRYDPENAEHAEICRGIEEGNGIPKMYGSQVALDALREVGFIIEEVQDMADVGDRIPWYEPLNGGFIGGFAMSRIGSMCTDVMVSLLERIGLAPKGTTEIQNTLKLAGESVVRGGKLGIFTPMYFFIARKPEEGEREG